MLYGACAKTYNLRPPTQNKYNEISAGSASELPELISLSTEMSHTYESYDSPNSTTFDSPTSTCSDSGMGGDQSESSMAKEIADTKKKNCGKKFSKILNTTENMEIPEQNLIVNWVDQARTDTLNEDDSNEQKKAK